MKKESDLSEIEKLGIFALETGRQIKSSETPYTSTSVHPVIYHKRTVCITDNNKVYYICFGDSRNFGNYANFSGVFFLLDTPLTTTITIRKKDILDKINPFLKCSNYKTGDNKFDSSIVLEENDINTADNILKHSEIRNTIIDFTKKQQLYRFGINEINLDFIEHFKNKSFIGIYILNDWIVDPKVIEEIFRISHKIIKIITDEKDI